MLERTAKFLASLPAAWAVATPAAQNQLARTLFERVELKDKRVVARPPQPAFAPFFVLDDLERRDSAEVRK